MFNSVAVVLNLIDIAFVRFEGKRATTDAFRVMGFGDDFVNTVPGILLDYWYLLLLLIAIMVLVDKIYVKIKITTVNSQNGFLLRSKTGQIILALSMAAFTFIGFRGGIQYRPINIMTASQYANGKETSLLLNTPFTILKTLGKNLLEPVRYYTTEESEKISPVIHFPLPNQTFRNKNVVLIIVESLGKEYIGSLNHKKGYTPFLDSLMKKSIVFPNAFANGKRSIEGIPCVIAGIPALMDEPFITSVYNGNRISGIASLLKKKGYQTLFFHGGTNGTMGFDNFSRMAGYDSYFGRKEYNDDADFDSNWGIYDEPFLQFAKMKLDATAQPFHATLFTLSSHHPYLIPEKYKGKFDKGTLPIHESIGYADYSLKKFFESASKTDWYMNTIFVITGDHTAIAEEPFYQSRVGMYAVPIIFYQAADSASFISDVTTNQIDIIPGILDYLHYDEPYFSFGKSMFDVNTTHEAVNYINGIYQIISGEYALTMDTANVQGLYHYTNDSLLSNNLKGTLPAIQDSLERKLKAMIQNYNDALMNNKMSLQ